MAQIVKTQKVEIGLEELIALLKKNWNLLAGYLHYYFLEEKKTVRVDASFNLIDIGNVLCNAVGLTVQINELEGAIADIFREIEHQNPHFKNMTIECSPPIHRSLNVSFDIDIAVAPVMLVEEPASPLTTALLRAGGNQDKVRHIGGGSVLDDLNPADSEFIPS